MADQAKPPSTDTSMARSDAALRCQAETIATGTALSSPECLDVMSPEEARQLVHELRVYQIELEMQNEELRRVQVELDAARARYFDLYDLAPVGYCTLSATGLILEANLAVNTMLGLARRALVQRPLSSFILKEDQHIFYLHCKQLFKTGEPLSCELRMMKNDDTPCWMHLTATVAEDDAGAPVQRVMLIDITERKLMEALKEKNIMLETARQVAEDASRAKSDFLSCMSHELRTPLNAILGFAQLMASELPPLRGIQKTRISRILQAGWHLLTLINDILDLGSVESGRLPLSMKSLSLPDVLLECQKMIEPQAQKSGIVLNFTQFASPLYVYADRIRVKQVLINLLSNAIKYNREGGTVEVTHSVTAAQRLRISVQDSGEGLSPEKLAQLFQPFNRLGQETSTKEGTGIGLVLSQQLVKAMGGDIGVHSNVGVGSVFWIELNLVVALGDNPTERTGD